MINWMFSLLVPILLHMLLSDFAVILVGKMENLTLTTSLAAIFIIPVAGRMYLIDRRKGIPEQTDRKRQFGFGCFCLAAGGILNVLWSGVLNWIQISSFFSNNTQETLLEADYFLQIIGLGLMVPLAEELVFRGLVYNRMKKILSIKWSIIFSAVLFAVYHGNPIQMIFAFPMALALTAVYEYGGRFCFPVLFHIGSNLAAIVSNYYSV